MCVCVCVCVCVWRWAQSERAMQTAGDREVPLGQAVHEEPHWIGDAFMH